MLATLQAALLPPSRLPRCCLCLLARLHSNVRLRKFANLVVVL